MRRVVGTFRRYADAVTLIIATAVAYLSLVPQENVPSAPGGDKFHHFVAYAALTFPISFAKTHSRLAIFVFAACFGGLIELLQPFSSRHCDWHDFGANTAGSCIGIAVGYAASLVL